MDKPVIGRIRWRAVASWWPVKITPTTAYVAQLRWFEQENTIPNGCW